MKPRLVRVMLFRHPWSGARLPKPVPAWACEGWIALTAHGAWFKWFYDGALV